MNERNIIVSLFGGVAALLEPAIPFIVICTIAIFADCFTAWSLSRRVMLRYPGANDGKFRSNYAGRVFITLLKVYALILLVYLIDSYIVVGLPVKLTNIVAGAICFWQLWSILENESSCSDAKWAKVAQRILVDKTERHFDLDLGELKSRDSNSDNVEVPTL